MNNENGYVLEDVMSYEDLMNFLEEDRQEIIDILVKSRVEINIEYDGLIESLYRLYEINGIKKHPDYYLQDEKILYADFVSATKKAYESMSNEEIINFYRENEPYVFGPINYLENLFNK